MTLWCVIPAKPFGEAKTRLAPDLPPETRALLAALFLRRTVQKVCGFAGQNPVMVVTRCPEILHLAQGYGAIGVHEGPKADVNTALATAAAHAMAHGASGILAVAADLPAITADDLAEMTAQAATRCIGQRQGVGPICSAPTVFVVTSPPWRSTACNHVSSGAPGSRWTSIPWQTCSVSKLRKFRKTPAGFGWLDRFRLAIERRRRRGVVLT
jgi:hypothetical protein